MNQPADQEAMSRESLHERIATFGLTEDASAIEAAAAPAARLRFEATALDELPARGTYAGGDPDLPQEFAWPAWRGKPLTFLAQFDLREVAATVDLGLPAEGLLSFFFDAVDQPWGFSPEDAGSAAVVWTAPGTPTIRTPRPASDAGPYGRDQGAGLSEYERLSPARATLRKMLTLPDAFHPSVRALFPELDSADDGKVRRYEALRESLYVAPHHQLGGYAFELQNPMEVECEYCASGNDGSDGFDASLVGAPEFERRAFAWRLLLSLDTDEVLGRDVSRREVAWASKGGLYVFNRAPATARRDFSSPWAVVQGT